MISIDWTIIATGIIFLLTMLAMNSILFKPLLRVMDEREKLTSGTRQEAEEKRRSLSELVDAYTGQVKEARQKGFAQIESVRKEASDRSMELISRAREEASAEMQKARDKVNSEVEMARKDLQSEVESIADSITSKILSSS